MATTTRKAEVDQNALNGDEALQGLVERLKKEGEIEYCDEAKDQSPCCWVVWDIGEYALENSQEIVQSVFETPEEAARAWAKFQMRGSSGS